MSLLFPFCKSNNNSVSNCGNCWKAGLDAKAVQLTSSSPRRVQYVCVLPSQCLVQFSAGLCCVCVCWLIALAMVSNVSIDKLSDEQKSSICVAASGERSERPEAACSLTD